MSVVTITYFSYESILREKNILEAELDDFKSQMQAQGDAAFNKEVNSN